MKQKLETVEQFLKRGGRVKQLPEEMEWDIIPLEEKIKFKSAVETLDYERDHKSNRY
tara:strand:- start:969 stop:1139 length:171 start_codon:yes stop_codon:yes gene_type:complete